LALLARNFDQQTQHKIFIDDKQIFFSILQCKTFNQQLPGLSGHTGTQIYTRIGATLAYLFVLIGAIGSNLMLRLSLFNNSHRFEWQHLYLYLCTGTKWMGNQIIHSTFSRCIALFTFALFFPFLIYITVLFQFKVLATPILQNLILKLTGICRYRNTHDIFLLCI